MSKTDIKIVSAIIFFVAAIAVSWVIIYRANTYYLHDVEVVSKNVKLNYVTNDYPSFFIVVQKGHRKAQLEIDSDYYRRIIIGQHIDVSVKKSSGYIRRYQINMDK